MLYETKYYIFYLYVSFSMTKKYFKIFSQNIVKLKKHVYLPM